VMSHILKRALNTRVAPGGTLRLPSSVDPVMGHYALRLADTIAALNCENGHSSDLGSEALYSIALGCRFAPHRLTRIAEET
jgi:hypothetical protein